MADTFDTLSPGLESPADNAAAVTPDDNTDLGFVSRGLYIGGSGDISIITNGGQTITFVGVPTGVILPVRATRVRATGTTATNIVAMW